MPLAILTLQSILKKYFPEEIVNIILEYMLPASYGNLPESKPRYVVITSNELYDILTRYHEFNFTSSKTKRETFNKGVWLDNKGNYPNETDSAVISANTEALLNFWKDRGCVYYEY